MREEARSALDALIGELPPPMAAMARELREADLEDDATTVSGNRPASPTVVKAGRLGHWSDAPIAEKKRKPKKAEA